MPAIDFPNTPTVGQQFTSGNTTWQWDGISWNTIRTPIVGPTGATGPTGADGVWALSSSLPPAGAEGDAWFDPNTGGIFIYYDGYWVEAGAAPIGPTGPAGQPGSIGPQGSPGATGATGPAGPAGAAGATGATGATGPAGESSGGSYSLSWWLGV